MKTPLHCLFACALIGTMHAEESKEYRKWNREADKVVIGAIIIDIEAILLVESLHAITHLQLPGNYLPLLPPSLGLFPGKLSR